MDYLNIKYEQISELVVGDVGGVLIPKPHIKKGSPADKALRKISERWMGIRTEHIAQCAAKARDSGGMPPGVVVLGVGRYRASVVYECIRLGLVNELVIDEDMALHLIEGPPFPEVQESGGG
jgi:hypothetical protein